LAGWQAQLAISAFNQLGQYDTVLVTEPTVTQYSLCSPLSVAVSIASTYFAYQWRDDQAELA